MADLRNLSSKYDIPSGYGVSGASTYSGMKLQKGPEFYGTPFSLGYGPTNPGYSATTKNKDPHVSSLDKGYGPSAVLQRMIQFGVPSPFLAPPRMDNYTPRNPTGTYNSGPASSNNETVSSYFSKSTNTYTGGVGPSDGRY